MASLNRSGGIGIILVILILLLAIVFTPLLVESVSGKSVNKYNSTYNANYLQANETITVMFENIGESYTIEETGDTVSLGNVGITSSPCGIAEEAQFVFDPQTFEDTITLYEIDGCRKGEITFNGTNYQLFLVNVDPGDSTATVEITYPIEETTTVPKTLSEKSKAVWDSVPILFVVACLLAIAVFWKDR